MKTQPQKPFGSTNEYHKTIAEHAYYIAERRGFEPGHEIEDWLIAESEVNQEGSVG